MKLITLLIFITCLHVSALTYAQKITLNEKDASLEKIFNDIRKQTGYIFFYKADALSGTSKVTINVKDATLQETLDQCLKDQPLIYTIAGNTVGVKKKENPTLQPKTIMGKVVDENGVPMVGVSVLVKETKRVTITDKDGSFTITTDDHNYLVFTYIGYAKYEINVNGKNYLDVEMAKSVSSLDAIQIIGYGTNTKRFDVGSVGGITAKQIERQPVLNPISALEGQVAGVFVSTQNGLPGGNITVQIRGRNSIDAGINPLYVVDGIPYNSIPLNQSQNDPNFIDVNGPVSPLNSISPDQIESIQVLKDADATAIYGSRGSNGVVLITTKKGKAGKTNLTLNINQGFTTVARYANFLNLQQYLTLVKEGYKNDGLTPSADPNSSSYAPSLMVWDTTKSTDWHKYLFGGLNRSTQATANLSGGDAGTHFTAGGDIHDEGSVLPGNQKYRRMGTYFTVEHIYKDFYALFKASYNADKQNLTQSPNIANIAALPPDYPLYNSDGSLNWYLPFNPLAYTYQKTNSQYTNLMLNGVMKYTLSRGLDIKANIGYNKQNADMVSTFPASSQWPLLNPVSYADFGTNNSETFLIEPQLTFNKDFNGNNKLNILVGSTFQHSSMKGFSVEGTNYTNEDFIDNLSYAGNVINPNNNFTEYKYFSVFGRINFINSDKYIVNSSFRRDGSSRFGPGDQYGNFGSIGGGWIFSEESLVKSNLHFLSFGKLKASYGITGNDQIGDYKYIATYQSGYLGSYQGQSTLQPSNVANGKYGWETNQKAQIGLDLGFLNDRILITTDAYLNRCDNLLVTYPLPATSGPFGGYIANLPAKIQNKGLELTVQTTNIKTEKFKWESNFNITFPRNKLISFPGIENTSYAYQYVVGKDLNTVKGYQFTGIDQKSGVPQFLDVNKDGQLTNPEDLVVLGSTSPNCFGGFTNNINFSGFELSVFVQYALQHSFGDAFSSIVPVSSGNNSYVTVLNRWQAPGQLSNIPGVTQTYGTPTSSADGFLQQSSENFINTSFARLKNVSLTYSLPSSTLKSLHIEQLKLYLQGQNLFLLTKDKNVDPETLNGNSLSVPVLKSIVFGIQLTL